MRAFANHLLIKTFLAVFEAWFKSKDYLDVEGVAE